ncbi:YegP family protein [Pantoea sp. B270]|uniref:YegP family protein n=1 Tax=Pantoea sp. B270 TaxID=2836826 RepID=UPI001BFF144D|nr:YegP family protein [Pantoea sp. B270]MBU6520792.1 YegP family protein [Pantoea sp. B270]
MNAPKYELRKGGTPDYSVWYFVLKSSDGSTLATSELYDSREAALTGIKSMRQSAASFTVNDLTEYTNVVTDKKQ